MQLASVCTGFNVRALVQSFSDLGLPLRHDALLCRSSRTPNKI